MKQYKTILAVINSTLPVNADAFEELCNNWLDTFFNSDISWNWISMTIHVETDAKKMQKCSALLLLPYSEYNIVPYTIRTALKKVVI